jgi:hypothetical protein
MARNQKLEVKGTEISITVRGEEAYISLTDIAKYRNSVEPFSVINNWVRSKSTIDFIGLWEKLNNPNFKPIEFERFKNEAGNNYFVLSPQRWIEATNAIGLICTIDGNTPPRPIAGLGDRDQIVKWTAVGHSLFATVYEDLKLKVSRLDLTWGRKETFKEINPADKAGIYFPPPGQSLPMGNAIFTQSAAI